VAAEARAFVRPILLDLGLILLVFAVVIVLACAWIYTVFT